MEEVGKEGCVEEVGKGEQKIMASPDLRRYRTELPNLYDDADLDPFEFRLLAHYKRVGNCTEGTATTARKTRMSVGQVSQKRQSLAVKGFIKMNRVEINGGFSYVITVVDKWGENLAKYSKSASAPSLGEAPLHEVNTPPSLGEAPLHEVKQRINLNTTATAIAPKNNENDYSGVVFRTYETEIGALTPTMSDALVDAIAEYPESWIIAAIGEAARANARRWQYVEAILRRWKVDGFQPRNMQKGQKGREKNGNSKNGVGGSPSQNQGADEQLREVAAEIRRRKSELGLL